MVFLLPEDFSKTTSIAEAVMHGAHITNFENRYRRKDDTVVPMLWSAQWDQETRTIYCVAKDATLIHETQAKAKLYEQRLLKAYKLGRIGWWEWDVEKNENFVSEELYQIYGLPANSVGTFSTDVYMSLVHPEDLPGVLEARITIQKNHYHQYEHRIIKPSGEIAFLIHYVESERNKKGVVQKVYGITKDITYRKAAELQLKASEQKLTQILESIGDCFFAVDRSWTVTYWNRKAEETLLRKKEDIVGKNLWDVYHEIIPLKFYTEPQRAVQEGVPVHFEEYFPPLGIWLEASLYPSAEGLSVYFKDITKKRKVEEELLESKERYEIVSQATSDAIWDWNLQAGTNYWSEGFRTIFGHSLENLCADISSWTQYIHPDDVERVVSSVQNTIDSAATRWTEEYRYRKKDGTYAHVIDKGFVIRDENGRAVRMVGALQDVTQQKEAELSLKLSEERFRLLFYESPRPKWMFKAEGLQIVEVNNAALELYGYTKAEFLQLTISDLKQPGDIPLLHDLVASGMNRYENIVQHRKKNGDAFSIEIAVHAIDLPTGRHFIVNGDDVTEKLRLQQMVVEEKMTAQKEVAKAIIATQERERSEIAKELHDNVNQILTTAKLYVENIGYYPTQQEVFIKKSVDLVQRSIDEIRILSKQLVTPAINDIGFKDAIDELLNHYLSLRLFEIQLHYGIVEEELDKGLELTIYRIVQEQLNNIVKYARASQVNINLLYEADVLKICIQDNGVGFDKETAGRGLGMNNMKNRAEVYKGTVEIDSIVGEGTTITVCFPHTVTNGA